MPDDSQRYWFPAKRYGWGWGPPICWQGWLVVIIFTAAVIAAGMRFMPRNQPLQFLLSVVALTFVFICICWLKGETPKWRWGDKE